MFGPIIVIGLLPPMMFLNNNCDCDPPLVVGGAFVVLAVATVAVWVLGQSDRYSRASGVLRLVGWAALSVATLSGATRALSDVSEILTL